MSIKKYFTVIILFVLLASGCASTCITETFYKPFPLNEQMEEKTWSRWTNYQLFMDVQEGFTISVFECGTAYRRPDNGPTGICVYLYIDEGNTVSFINDDFILTDITNHAIGNGLFRKNRSGEEQLIETQYIGSKDGSRSAFDRAFSKVEGWKRYSLNIDLPVISNSEFIMLFPEIKLNGKRLSPVLVKFKRITDDVCHTTV